MTIANTIDLQRDLALEQRKERRGLLERLLGKVLGMPLEEPLHARETRELPQPMLEPEPGFLASIGAFLSKINEKAAEIGDSIRDYFQNTPQQFEVVHIGADATATRINPEAQETQVRDSLAAVLGTFSPGNTPSVPRSAPEAYHGPQLGLSLRATHA